MKKVLKILLIAAASVILIFAVFILSVCLFFMNRMKSEVDAFDKTSVDVREVADGVYEGHSETTLVKVDVKVTVSDGEITDLVILKHECGRGKPAEDMIPNMIEKNDVEVDAVSGATYSSEVIKDAVRNALRKGL